MGSEPKGKEICERTRGFALRIIKLYRAMKEDEVGAILGRQLLRCGASIGANVEEAQAGQSKRDFAARMSIALREARETRYWLTLTLESELFPSERLDPILAETEEIIKILYTIIQKTRQNQDC